MSAAGGSRVNTHRPSEETIGFRGCLGDASWRTRKGRHMADTNSVVERTIPEVFIVSGEAEYRGELKTRSRRFHDIKFFQRCRRRCHHGGLDHRRTASRENRPHRLPIGLKGGGNERTGAHVVDYRHLYPLTGARSYKPAFPADKAFAILEEWAPRSTRTCSVPSVRSSRRAATWIR